jgi:hypothetical protein
MNRLLTCLILVASAGVSSCTAQSPGEPMPAQPPSPEPGWQPGPAYVDETEILMMESYPVQVALLVRGSLPTPCHQLTWEVAEPTAQGVIHVRLYSLADPELSCIQVLEAFEESIPLGEFTEGTFEVMLNGERVGEFAI